MPTTHLIGLLLGTEDDWPTAFEEVVRRAAVRVPFGGDVHELTTERITIEPFNLRYVPRYRLVVDRLAHWYYVPREWLKKVALMDRVYLLNSPFTFQSMEKHAAYCAMMRLGLKVPDTWLIPTKEPIDNPRYPYTASKYNRPFDLPSIAEDIGYPIFMKPFDGGAWVGVSRVKDHDELMAAYDASGQRLMHLQSSVEGYDAFARALTIGAETLVVRYDPEQPQHGRYQVQHGFLRPQQGEEVVRISRLVNAFFRWEFNSCECLVRGDDVHPIDYANACPDLNLTSLHYYFPWAISTLFKWSAFCAITDRRMRITFDVEPYLAIADRDDLSYDEKLLAYGELVEEYLDTDRYREFCAEHLAHVDEVVLEYVAGRDFDRLLVETVRATFPAHEHEAFIAHYRGLVGAWVRDARAWAAG